MKLLRFTIVHELLLALIILLLPWQARWIAIPGTLNGATWEYGTLSLYAVDILVLCIIAVSCAIALMNTSRPHIHLSGALALFLLIVSSMGIAFATNTLSAIFWLAKLAEGVALFFCISLARLPFERIAMAWTVAGVIQSILAILQFTTQRIVGSTWFGMANQDPNSLGVQVIQTEMGRVLRAYGSLPHPNMLAGFLVITIIVGLVLFWRTDSAFKRVLLPIAVGIEASALWMTFSRQAWIALAVALIVCTAYAFKVSRSFPSRVAFGIGCTVLPMVVFSLVFPELMHSRIDTQNRLEQQSVNERQEYVEESIAVLREHWFTGIGIGNNTAYTHDADRDRGIYKSGSSYQPVHNVYLLVFVELGIFGLVGFLLFGLSLLYKTRWRHVSVFTWSVCLIALAVIGFFDHYLWSLHFGILLFWIAAGLLSNAKEHVDNYV